MRLEIAEPTYRINIHQEAYGKAREGDRCHGTQKGQGSEYFKVKEVAAMFQCHSQVPQGTA